MHACLAVTCHLHFWQNDRDLLRATAVTRGWYGYRNKSHTESWPWKRKLSRRSRRDSNPLPYNHESGALTTKLSPFPQDTNCDGVAFLPEHMAIHPQRLLVTKVRRSSCLLWMRSSLLLIFFFFFFLYLEQKIVWLFLRLAIIYRTQYSQFRTCGTLSWASLLIHKERWACSTQLWSILSLVFILFSLDIALCGRLGSKHQLANSVL